MILRCTTKLLKRLDVEPVAAPRASTAVLGDWYATLLHTRRGQFVLAISRVTLQPIVVIGRDLRSFPVRLATGVAEVLATYGVPNDAIERERLAMSEVHYATTDDRSTVGVLTELQRLLHYDLDELPNLSMHELSLRLARTPIVARNVYPVHETCRVFGVARPPSV